MARNLRTLIRACGWRVVAPVTIVSIVSLVGCDSTSEKVPKAASSSAASTAFGEQRLVTKSDSPSPASPSPAYATGTGATQDRSAEKPQAEKPQDGAKPNEAATKPAAVQEKPKEVELDASVLIDELLAARLSTEELDQGWIRLFDGQSMIGWKNTSTADWAVKDGELVANTGEPGLLVTQVRFSDYEIELEYFASEQTNSGVFLRTPEKPTDPAKDCFELNIAPPDNPFPTGSLVARAKVDESIDEPNSGEWNTLHALVDQNRVQAWVNGQQSVDYTDDTGLTSGRIGLQFREGPIRFRNIRIRPIGYSLIPNAKPSDWNEPKGMIEAKFTETGTIQLKGGRGHLELLQPHANVCIQATALTLVENVNSGIFFRCIPGEDMNGYECQIHHGFKEDRRRAVDAGSGSIFRRQNAKAVLSDEGRPAHLTIVADGPVIATWVEGIQVVQWEDTRKPDDNPRKGLRTAAGTIMLQGHDPTTEIEFTRLMLSPITDTNE